MKQLPTVCPACECRLKVKSLVCDACETVIEGDYGLPLLASVSAADQAFIVDFIKVSGSLKEMAKLLGLSYPTVRNRLDEIIVRVKDAEHSENSNGKE